jgi:acetyl CoA:N6-hydroxylysine acetyl transferase
MKNEITYSPLAFNEEFKVSMEGSLLQVRTTGDRILRAHTYGDNQLKVVEKNSERFHDLLLVGLEHMFGQDSSLLQITLEKQINEYPFNHLGQTVYRSEFFQVPLLWKSIHDQILKPEKWTETKGVTHPVRERLPEGIFYKKFVPQIGKTLTLRLLNPGDLETFHNWHNQPRVSHFWELNQSKEELAAYIEKSLKDPHQFPVMVKLDEDEVGYYEFYWVKEDRLGPYYDSEAFDRGFHFLIGNKDYLGFKTTDSLIKTVLHFLYLDDPRTRKIMAEPRHDNQKVLKYAEASIGWTKLKEFDFPHKRAALLENRREIFFGGHAL